MKWLLLALGLGALSDACASDTELSSQGDEPIRLVKFCNLMTCFDGVRVELERPFSRPGSYALHLSNRPHEPCNFELPLTEVARFACGEALELFADQAGALTGFRVYGRPSQLDVAISIDQEVHHGRLEKIDYRKLLPNGPDCEPTCWQSSQTLRLEVR